MYATPTDLIDRFRADVLADLLPIPASVGSDEDAVRTAVVADRHVQTALEDASAAIDAALTASRRYGPEDLRAWGQTGHPLLVRVACELAVALLWERSQSRMPAEAVAARTLAEETLERLRTGQIILPRDGSDRAGLASAHRLGTLHGRDASGGPEPRLTDRMRRYWPSG